MRKLRVWPHLTIIATLVAVLAGVGVAFWLRHVQNAKAEELQTAARVERIEGQVAINNLSADGLTTEWVEAVHNTPVSVGDRIYTRESSSAALAFSGRNFARLNLNSEINVLALSDRRTQLALRDGSALFDVGYLPSGGLFEVATPVGAVDFYEPGLYEVGLNDDGSAWISVLSGLAQVVGLAGSGQISKGEMLTLLGQTAASVALARIDPGYAGGLLDDYYGYRYPNQYDGRYRDYNVYLNDPYYFDPYRRYQSYQYASDYIPGLYDLDHYGDWIDVSGYGYSWRPRVDTGWAPYQSGYWVNDYPYGPTWISNEPWGYAPYHYGRWAYVNNQWFWIPERVSTQPLYAPALVAFLPLNQNGIGWVPLAPGDPYAPRYYDSNWQPHYLHRIDLTPQQVINLDVPGAITIVPWDSFDDYIYRDRISRGDRHSIAGVQPVLEPLLDTPLRNAALRSAWGRGKIDLPPGIARKLDDTRVFANADLPDFRFGRRDLGTRRLVDRAPEQARRAELKVRDERQPDRVRGRTNQVDRGNESANSQRQLRRIQRQQERQLRQQQRPQQPQGTRVGNERRSQRPVERSQAQRPRGQGPQRPQRRVERQQQRPARPAPRPQQLNRSVERDRPRPSIYRGRQNRASIQGPPVRQESRPAPQRAQRPQVHSQPRAEQQQMRRAIKERPQVHVLQKPQPQRAEQQQNRGNSGKQEQRGGGKVKGRP